MSRNVFINDLFWTVQGEGANSGRRALFVRMPYCNLRCSFCDTNFDSHKIIPVDELIEVANNSPKDDRFAVITGGEPMMHRHTPVVVDALRNLGFTVACETNGTFPAPCHFEWITCSPKADAEYMIHPELWNRVDEFKYVVHKDFDWSVLERHKGGNTRLYLSPEYDEMAESIQKIMAYLEKEPAWRLSLQTHKWIGVP